MPAGKFRKFFSIKRNTFFFEAFFGQQWVIPYCVPLFNIWYQYVPYIYRLLLFLKKFYQNESKFFSSFEWPMFQNHITQNLLLLRFFVKYIAIVHKEWTRTHVLISRLKFIKCQCFPHRNQSADLHSKSGGWFLYEGNTGT